ncbi:YopX family protein [Bacteroides pyogenes]|uniref:YopX family protein n=1 Tax=Bacteroides pyogenes TaxID=310300 RepID=UPI001BABE731|nr:YopX family protein [Bacteroides pyogenes]MBR8725440.1 hypothetical protein [Bacteroides pyogenes]MBR8740063.1 hypothetical protein [Bacteroides pyogenes]MBR8755820.1 hypothetical protein [Bacteroides pyogenes]MBR8796012.1 hypothetical protein [Bacteroides pyogenes]MBR8810749.1 hypothetical protein [Bacteroides pyogenes]
MKREVKFRGFNEVHNQWIYGYYFKYPSGLTVIYETDSSCWGVIPSTVGQYTGMKDKNGKEIYEGDIVRHRGYNGMKISVVVFSDGCFNVGRHQGSSTKETPMLIASNCEVIDNVHDNPELLCEK